MKESIKSKIDKLKEFIKVHPYIYGLILSLFISLFASFFFFSSVSPIFSGAKDFSYDVGSVDSNYFMYTGKRILAGDLPYIDFFDHKGVLVFYFNAFLHLCCRWVCTGGNNRKARRLLSGRFQKLA